ncbi:MAG: putative phage tail assembly chaperone [Desulforhopalus sp.]
MSEKITLKLNGKSVGFDVTNDTHERLINEMQPTDKVGPMHNFLVRTVDQESKETLAPFLKSPSSIMAITEKIIEKFTPQLKITVGE